MKGLFDKLEIKNQNNISKSEKKRLNSLLGNALDLKSEYKVYHASSKLKLIRDSSKFICFEYYDKICPTIETFDRSIFKCVTLDSGAVGPLTRGADAMCPGIIKYKELCDRFEKDEAVGIEIFGQGVFAIGVTLMSYDEMMNRREGPVISILHVKGDRLDLGTI